MLSRASARSCRAVAYLALTVAVTRLPLRSEAAAAALRHVIAPRPALDPWDDGQPVDTALGNYFMGAYGDSTLLDFNLNQTAPMNDPNCPAPPVLPNTMELVVPDPCVDTGTWSATNGSRVVMDWSSSCGISTPGLAPVLTYANTGGARFATSEKALTLTGTKVRLLDCNGNVRYILEEKIYYRRDKVDPSRCRAYNSCVGTVYFQYFIRGFTGAVVAKTSYLRLFEEQFVIRTKSGRQIASIKRVPGWSPTSTTCGGTPKKWTLDFATDVGGAQIERWPVAALVTLMTMQDTRRATDGFAWPTGCEVWKSIGLFLLSLLSIFSVIAGAMLFRMLFLNRCQVFLSDLEDRFCPKRMLVPAKFEHA